MGSDAWQRVQMALLVLALGFVLWLLAPALMPFLIAAFLAYIANPLADRLERFGLGRTLAVTIVFSLLSIGVLVLIAILIPLIERQISRAIAALPMAVTWFQSTAAPWLQEHLHLSSQAFDPQHLVDLVRQHWQQAGGLAAALLGHISRSSLVLIEWLVNLVLIPVVTFYLLRDWGTIVKRIRELLPRQYEPTIIRLIQDCDSVLGSFIKGQVVVMLALGLFYALALSLVAGLTLGPLIGIIAGLVSFVPYLGVITGLAASLIAVFAQYGDWSHILLVLGVFAVGQALEGYFLVPKLVGDKIGLHPVAVMFAVLAGGQLFGFFGVLLALPVAAVTTVLLRFAHTRYVGSQLYTAHSGEVDDPTDVDSDCPKP